MTKYLTLFGLAGLGGLYYFNTRINLEFIHTKIPPQYFIYKQDLSSYSLFTPAVHSLRDEFEHLEAHSLVFGGLFYDHPTKIQHQNKEQSILGIFVNESESKAVKSFLTAHPEYSCIKTDEVQALSVTYPYTSHSSFGQLGSLVYPRLYEIALKEKDIKVNDLICVVHKYHYLVGNNKVIEVLLPYGKNSNEFILTTAPQHLKNQFKDTRLETVFLNALACSLE